ncbi:MAG TPA: PspC domain-containing protein, partial [Euzebya sp.]|nr:PspC domain-containing protein [Euzebya sp.]
MSTIPPPPAPPPAPAPAPPRRLVRLEDQGKIAGVAAGIGWYFGIDPVLVRIALVVLTIGTGLGIPAYIIAWVVLPGVKSTDADLASPPPPTEGRPLAVLVIGTVVALLLLGQIDLFSGEVMTAAVLIGIGVLLFTDASSLGLGSRRPGNHHRGGPPPWARRGPWQAPPTPQAPRPPDQQGPQPPLPHHHQPAQHRQSPAPASAAAPGQAPWATTPPVPPEPSRAPRCGPKPHSAYAPYAGAWR